MCFEELPSQLQKRLQLPKEKLTKEEKKLRKQLFHTTGWIDAYGHRHWFRTPNPEGNYAKRRANLTSISKNIALAKKMPLVTDKTIGSDGN